MAAMLVGNELSRTGSSGRSWRSQSIREVWQGQPDVFSRNGTWWQESDDEEELRWAAIERLPTHERMRTGVLQQVGCNGREVEVAHLGAQDKKQLMERILKVAEEDNEKFLERLRNRTNRYVHKPKSPNSFAFTPRVYKFEFDFKQGWY